MARRVHVRQLIVGEIALDDAQAHHARDVLRLPDGTAVELFDDAGATATALVHWGAPGPRVSVVAIHPASPSAQMRLTIAAAVAKGDRADWMVEKLSELGVEAFIPLAADRSVVLPQGSSKRDRWARIATEAAKQSYRQGVMRIGELSTLQKILAGARNGGSSCICCLSTEPGAEPLRSFLDNAAAEQRVTALIGPEGGWSAGEIEFFKTSRIRRLSLGSNVLRIETAAIAIASICLAGRSSSLTVHPQQMTMPSSAAP